MTDRSLTLRPADVDDLDSVETLLANNGLPYQDVQAKPECFFVASSDGERIGVGGVETYAPHGLLRSVVVAESERGRGHGAALTDALERHARTNGVETLYLLTTTAPAFFRRRGYEAVAREDVPSRIRETTEFAELCPASATSMKKELNDGGQSSPSSSSTSNPS
jgi:amino-acid N-acetyltransferase